MEDKVLSERDIHDIVKIFQQDSVIIRNMPILCGALGLTLGEHDEISSRVLMERSGSYEYMSLVLSKWIALNAGRATVNRLVMILREESFNYVADELLKKLETQPTPHTQSKTTEKSGLLFPPKSKMTDFRALIDANILSLCDFTTCTRRLLDRCQELRLLTRIECDDMERHPQGYERNRVFYDVLRRKDGDSFRKIVELMASEDVRQSKDVLTILGSGIIC